MRTRRLVNMFLPNRYLAGSFSLSLHKDSLANIVCLNCFWRFECIYSPVQPTTPPKTPAIPIRAWLDGHIVITISQHSLFLDKSDNFSEYFLAACFLSVSMYIVYSSECRATMKADQHLYKDEDGFKYFNDSLPALPSKLFRFRGFYLFYQFEI